MSSLMRDIVTEACRTLQKIDDALKKDFAQNRTEPEKPAAEQQDSSGMDKPILLRAPQLQQIRWMSARQIGLIYGYGKKKVRIDDTPAAYQELRWMSEEQLNALFGKDGINV